MYQRLDFIPGVDRENTSFKNEGRWYDAQMVRFRSGTPEKYQGWQRTTDDRLIGVCRFSFVWRTLNQTIYTAFGTNKKMYVESGGILYDITPIRETQALTDAFSTTSGSTTVTVTDIAHGAGDGDFVTFSGAAAVGGIPADDLNQEFEITVIDSDTYTIEVATAATSTTTGGGASIAAEYQLNTGRADQIYSYGFGAGEFGASTWGTPRSDSAVSLYPRTWTGSNWGEDFVFSPFGGAVYLWDATFPQQRATRITQAPSKNAGVFVTNDRHLVCYGCNDPDDDNSDRDDLQVRWCDQENYTEWTASITNTAGRYTLTGGTRILSAAAVEGQNVLFTDENVYSMQFIGPPYTFGFQQIGTASGIISPMAWVAYNGVLYWMGRDSFYTLAGSVSPLDSTLQRFVFRNMTDDQNLKVFATVDPERHEITWFYPTQHIEDTYLNGPLAVGVDTVNVATTAGFRDSGYILVGDERIHYTSKNDTQFLGCTRGVGGTEEQDHDDKTPVRDPDGVQVLEPNRYVTYSITENIWWGGRLERSSMLAKGALKHPIGTTRRGDIYEHDFGTDADGQPLTAYVESTDFDLGEGDKLMFVRCCVPDFTVSGGSVNLSLRTRYYAQSSQVSESIGPVQSNTQFINTRIRGRQMSIRVESNDLGVDWKYGSPRLDLQPDGRR